MKALSIKQPWAWLIVNGWKDIENRTWKTKYQGQFLIHTGLAKPNEAQWNWYQKDMMRLHGVILPPMLPECGVHFGGIVGTACLIDCVEESWSEWFEPGGFGFRLTGAVPLPFKKVKGQLRFFEVDYKT